MEMWNYELTTTTDWIIALIAIIGVLGTIIASYIQWKIDKGKIDNKFKDNDKKFLQNDKRFEQMENQLKEHMESTINMAETNRKENRDEHQLLFQRIDEIKNLIIEGKISRRK